MSGGNNTQRRSCETNPILPHARRLTEEIVQNEAKLRGTGVCGQSQLPCWACPGRGVKRAKRTQFRPVGRRRRRVNAQNEPNLARCGRVAAGIVRNEPNFAPGIDRPARRVPVGLNIPPFQDSISRSGYVKCAARCLDHARHDKREGVCLRRGCRASGFAEGGVCGTKDWA
jgi:hypothetical protein